MSSNMRSCYSLYYGNECLLVVDADVTPPFIPGEAVELYNTATQEKDGWFVVTRLSRRIPYREIMPGPHCVPMAGQEVIVHLELLGFTPPLPSDAREIPTVDDKQE
mgnify:CR=1 FL=1